MMGDSGVVTVVQMLQMLMGEKKSCGSREVLIDRRNVTGGTHFSYYQQRCALYVTIMLTTVVVIYSPVFQFQSNPGI